VVGVLSVRDLLPVMDFMPVAVERMMSRLPLIVPVDETVRNAAALMAHGAVSAVLVSGRRLRERPMHVRALTHADLAGIMTGTDLVRDVLATDRYPYVTPVAEVMSTPLQTIEAREPIKAAFSLMARESVRHVLIRKGEEITGLLSVEDAIDPMWLQIASVPLRAAPLKERF